MGLFFRVWNIIYYYLLLLLPAVKSDLSASAYEDILVKISNFDNSLGKARFSSKTTVPQCTKQGL